MPRGKMHENTFPFPTRNFRKLNEMQSDQGLELPCGRAFNSVCCVLSCRFRRKIETVFGIFGLFCLHIVATKRKLISYIYFVELGVNMFWPHELTRLILGIASLSKLPRARKRAVLYKAREIVCESSHDCFVFIKETAKKLSVLQYNKQWAVKAETRRITFSPNLVISFKAKLLFG